MQKIRSVRLLAMMLVAVLAPRAHAGTPAAGFSETTVVSGLSVPTALAFLPDGRMLVTQQSGELLLVDGGAATLLVTLPVCFSEFPAEFGTETGLLGVAVHPDFPTSRQVYLFRTRTLGSEPCTQAQLFGAMARNELVSVELAAGDTVDIGSLAVLLGDMRAETGYHNGGTVRVGPDRKLYLSVGDNGVLDPEGPPGSSANPYAQDLSTVEGKILRLELSGGVPSDNPFVGTIGAREEIFARGFRNPFRFAFDPATESLWAGDVGEDTIEEIDRVVAGGNYAWPRCEGTLPSGCALVDDVAPVFTYPHSGAGALGESVIGGAFPQGGALATYADRYFFADFDTEPGSGAVYAVALDGARTGFAGTPDTIVTNAGGPVDLVVGPDGALYYVAYLDGAVRRVVPAGAASCATIAECQTALDAVRPDPKAAKGKLKRTAKRLLMLDRKADGLLRKAGTLTGAKQAKRYLKARHTLEMLLTAARGAAGKSRLGVELAPLEAAVNALLGLIPAG